MSLSLILIASLLASASPGPATLSIAGMSMSSGRGGGLALAAGVTTGSFMWSISAALGLSALMMANAWFLEVMRYVGAGYLLFLAWKSAQSAMRAKTAKLQPVEADTLRAAYLKGLALHLTNPKAILFFGALYSVAVPAGVDWSYLAIIILGVGLQSTIVFHGYAILFSTPKVQAGYARLKWVFDGLFALFFGAAGLKILTTRVAP